jgi:hypothetical protein
VAAAGAKIEGMLRSGLLRPERDPVEVGSSRVHRTGNISGRGRSELAVDKFVACAAEEMFGHGVLLVPLLFVFYQPGTMNIVILV